MFVEICLTLENLGQSLTYKLIYILVRVVLSSHRSVQYDIYSLSLTSSLFLSWCNVCCVEALAVMAEFVYHLQLKKNPKIL